MEIFLGDLVRNAATDHPFLQKIPKIMDFSYASGRSISSSYQTAFGKDALICKLAEDARLRALAQLRHVISHRLGKADAFFIHHRDGTTKEGYPPCILLQKWYGGVQIDDDVELDGGIVCEAVDGAVEVCFHLLSAVNDWLLNKAHVPCPSSP